MSKQQENDPTANLQQVDRHDEREQHQNTPENKVTSHEQEKQDEQHNNLDAQAEMPVIHLPLHGKRVDKESMVNSLQKSGTEPSHGKGRIVHIDIGHEVGIKIRSPASAEIDTFYCLEAPVKCISFCTEVTS